MIDIRLYGAKADGVTDCITAISAAILVGDIIIQNGTFVISESIKIPSNRTIYGKNAKLKMADGSYDNAFRNSDFDGGNVNVKVIGLGNFLIDGNTVNNIEVNPFTDISHYTRYPNIYGGDNVYKYNLFFFYNVTGFEVSGINFIDRPHFVGVIAWSSEGVIDNIYLNYYTLTLNQDGIDFANGCHNIAYGNIRGYCGDDWTGLGAGDKFGFNYYSDGWNIGDIHDISFSNIKVFSELYHLYIIICGDGNKVYNISFDDILINYCGGVLYTGYTSFRTVAPTKEDIQNITMDNILVKTMREDHRAAFSLGEDCQDITITNFTNESGEPDFEETGGLDIVNFTINGTAYPL